ncbi:sensor domain-containing protein [Nocardia canadensis]|uniref:sensor domain-containing protein n=1 Tax=Nocardia canadensis TaxID=3065238 RepID=UPI00292E1B7B|nr:sensor domain-containing protein [Nocardia canadensis]
MNVAETTPAHGGDRVRRPGQRRRTLACSVVLAGLALTGCGQSIDGTPVAQSAMAVRHIDGALADLLPTAQQFPARYPAVVLPPQAAAAAAGDLDGVGAGATVRPAKCTPPDPEPGAEPAAVAVGNDDASRATLTVELSRTTEAPARLRDRLAGCEQIRVSRAGAESTVTTVLDTTSPTGADDAVSLRRTVVPDVGGAGLTQTMQTTIGQIGDVRITVTSMTFGAGLPDQQAVAEMFATAVRRIRGA